MTLDSPVALKGSTMDNSHILLHICYLRYQRGWLIGELMNVYSAREVVDAMGVLRIASELGVFDA